jgi:preprotein translocase subunit SecD
MKPKSIILLIVLLISFGSNLSGKDLLSFELRLAKLKPDSSLKEMVFYNSDEIFFIEDSVFLSNEDLISAEVIDQETQPKILVTLSDKGRQKFYDFTKNNIGRNAAMIVDGELVSAPRIQAQISEGRLIIAGFFSLEEANSIATGIIAEK